ncbi:metal-sensitive transcriptional regulator [Leucobacter luti]|uniref:DNA-binding FrmR family transcriptional regulator n=1 Tax=Leucobacter luti TaxID=340320 RepID=A0A4Q7U7S0_9MICO|nr:metal-sensitive transcriptional regulator [Leucobacter luti]MBL3700585.1 metal-sensitive transcriptional regulator [Leucobacter luti]RZT68578.1 DNA-binding FrmR family transcriptional regulator [Leucobacter luti]
MSTTEVITAAPVSIVDEAVAAAPLGAEEVAAPEAAAGADTATVCDHGSHGYLSDKSKYLARLKRIEGQARGIHRMVEEEQYCIDILTQVSAITSALQGVALGLLEDHLRHCVTDAARVGGQVAEDKIAEATRAIARLVR